MSNSYDTRLPAVRVDQAIRDALQKRANQQRIGLAEAHRQALAAALLVRPPAQVVGRIGPEQYPQKAVA